MTEAEIKRLIRRGIREPKPKVVDDADLTATISDAINIMGQRILANEPDFYKKRISISSDSNIFLLPAACDRILRVWDLGDNALSVSTTSAAGSGAVIITTTAVHGLTTGDIVTINDVTGTTEANGTWHVTVVDTTNFTLTGSTYANAFVSGGKCFKEETNFTPVIRIDSKEVSGTNTYKWYSHGINATYKAIAIDDPDYTYDIIVDYRYVPATVTEIPAKLHFGIVSYGVIDLLTVPSSDNKNYRDLKNSYDRHSRLWQLAYEMTDNFGISKESTNISDVKRIKRRI